MQKRLKAHFLRIDTKADRLGPPVRRHAGQCARRLRWLRADSDEAGSDRLCATEPDPDPDRARFFFLSSCLTVACARHRRPPQHAAAAMVLEDESSDDNSSLPYMHSETSTDGLNQVSYSIGARVRVRFRKFWGFFCVGGLWCEDFV